MGQYKESLPKALIFEKYILTLLSELAKSENKNLNVGYNNLRNLRHQWDACAPQGLNDLQGPLAIEIKYISRFSSKRFDQIVKQLNEYLNSDINTFLLVTNVKDQTEINKYPNITIWDGNKINEIAKKFPEVSFQYSDFHIPGFLEYSKKNKEREKLLDKTVSKYETFQYNSDKKYYIQKLKTAYNQDDLVLCLGAGVSIDEGLPNWERLIKSLIKDFLRSNYNKNIENLQNEINDEFGSFSNITLGRFIKKALKSKFHYQLKKCLYEEYSRTHNSESLLDTVTDFCRPVRGKFGIYSIITYNYDDLLEFYLEKKGVKHTVIYREYDVAEKDSLPIYHVHGFLPQKGRLDKQMKNSIVFDEEEYHYQYEKPFSWQNLTQLNLFKDKTVLFIGVSGTDPNLRRLLDIARAYSKDDINHYAILKNHWDLNNKKLANIFRNMEEDTFKELGINVIWYNDHPEINGIINEIKN